MVSSAFEAAQEDLVALSPPQGLTEALFTASLYRTKLCDKTSRIRRIPLKINDLARVLRSSHKSLISNDLESFVVYSVTAYVTGILKQMPLLTEIDKLASTGLTDTKAHEFLADRLGSTGQEHDYVQVWRVVKLWLMHYFPDSYRIEIGQEVLVKGRELPQR